jgi:hypothetical protein
VRGDKTTGTLTEPGRRLAGRRAERLRNCTPDLPPLQVAGQAVPIRQPIGAENFRANGQLRATLPCVAIG